MGGNGPRTQATAQVTKDKRVTSMAYSPDRERILEAARQAAKIVATWPAWKRAALEESMKPTVRVPREPPEQR